MTRTFNKIDVSLVPRTEFGPLGMFQNFFNKWVIKLLSTWTNEALRGETGRTGNMTIRMTSVQVWHWAVKWDDGQLSPCRSGRGLWEHQVLDEGRCGCPSSTAGYQSSLCPLGNLDTCYPRLCLHPKCHSTQGGLFFCQGAGASLPLTLA